MGRREGARKQRARKKHRGGEARHPRAEPVFNRRRHVGTRLNERRGREGRARTLDA